MPAIKLPSTSFPAALRAPATLVPIVIIAVLAAALAAHQVITRWDQLNPGRGWIAAAAVKIPDEADAVVVVNLAALRNNERRNTVNRWRVAAVDNGASDLTSWADTGHPIDDDTLAAAKATRITWMRLSAPGGQAVTVEASPGDSTDETSPAENAGGEGRWTKLDMPDGFALLQNPASAGVVGRDAADKSLAAARDYQQAKRAIDEPNLVFAFARWRSLPPEMIPAIAHPLSCDTDRWVAAGIDVPAENRLTITVACPHPPGQWGSGPLRTTATSPEDWDATIGATFPNHWNALQGGPAAPAVSWIAGPIVNAHPEVTVDLISQLTGDAWLAYRQAPQGDQWSLTLPFTSEPSEIRQAMQNIAGDQQPPPDGEDSPLSLRHPAFPDHPIRVSVTEDNLILGNTLQPTDLSPHQSQARTTGQWNAKAMTAWTRAVWPAATPWVHNAEVNMNGTVDAAVNIYQADAAFQN